VLQLKKKQDQQQQVEQAATKSAVASNNNKVEDGYNWRKYGQKQVKSSENPRSYYKCTYHSCSMKKKVERSLADGRVTQIVYKGTHNHPKPVSTRRNSSSFGGGAAEDRHHSQAAANSNSLSAAGPEHSGATPENSSVTCGDDDGASQRSEGDEPEAKRW
jgi:WRKY transcription factor 33